MHLIDVGKIDNIIGYLTIFNEAHESATIHKFVFISDFRPNQEYEPRF